MQWLCVTLKEQDEKEKQETPNYAPSRDVPRSISPRR
jgi:hypothetical protein